MESYLLEIIVNATVTELTCCLNCYKNWGPVRAFNSIAILLGLAYHLFVEYLPAKLLFISMGSTFLGMLSLPVITNGFIL